MGFWLNFDSIYMIRNYPSILRSWEKDTGVPHARTCHRHCRLGWAGPRPWAWHGVVWHGEAGRQCAGRRGWVLPHNPHNYESFSLLWWRRLDCESFVSYRLLASPSPGLVRSLFASLPRAYIQKSSVNLLLLRSCKNTTSSVACWFSRPSSLRVWELGE
jgi:hypothetical protein